VPVRRKNSRRFTEARTGISTNSSAGGVLRALAKFANPNSRRNDLNNGVRAEWGRNDFLVMVCFDVIDANLLKHGTALVRERIVNDAFRIHLL
jgi:hypothetical protein